MGLLILLLRINVAVFFVNFCIEHDFGDKLEWEGHKRVVWPLKYENKKYIGLNS